MPGTTKIVLIKSKYQRVFLLVPCQPTRDFVIKASQNDYARVTITFFVCNVQCLILTKQKQFFLTLENILRIRQKCYWPNKYNILRVFILFLFEPLKERTATTELMFFYGLFQMEQTG